MRKLLRKILSERTKIFKNNINIIESIFNVGEKATLYKAISKNGLVSGTFEITDKKFVKNEDHINGIWAYKMDIKNFENQWWGEMVMKKAPEMAPLTFTQLMKGLKNQKYIKQ